MSQKPSPPPHKEQPRITRSTCRRDKEEGKGKGGFIGTEHLSDSECDYDSGNEFIPKKKRASQKGNKKLSKTEKAPTEKGKKQNDGSHVMNLDDVKEDSPVFEDTIADGKREWEVVKMHPILGNSSVYEHIVNIDIDWDKVNSFCLYFRLCVHRQHLTYFIPYLLLLDQKM